MPCTESLAISNCIWFQDESDEHKKNVISSIIAGLLFFIGWWLLIDANVVQPNLISTGYYIWGILGTVSLIIKIGLTWYYFLCSTFAVCRVNTISQSQIHEDSSGGYLGVNGARAWLFVGFVLGFASVIASFWIFFADFYPKQNTKTAGIELLLQNILIFLSSLTYKFGRVEEL